jgi:hypothetical protein
VDDPSSRHPSPQVFVAAQRRGELTLQQLWLRYVALTGTCAMIEIDAFLHGLGTLPAGEQDKLAHALNERLDELYQASRVPYLAADLSPDNGEDPLAVLQQLLDRPPTPKQSNLPD